MSKLRKKAICLRRKDGRTDPNYRRASLLKITKVARLHLEIFILVLVRFKAFLLREKAERPKGVQDFLFGWGKNSKFWPNSFGEGIQPFNPLSPPPSPLPLNVLGETHQNNLQKPYFRNKKKNFIVTRKDSYWNFSPF